AGRSPQRPANGRVDVRGDPHPRSEVRRPDHPGCPEGAATLHRRHRQQKDAPRARRAPDGRRSQASRARKGARADWTRPRRTNRRGDGAGDPVPDGCGPPWKNRRPDAWSGGRAGGVKAEALRGAHLNAAAIDGAVLAQTLMVPDDHHRVLLLKGRILTRKDWPAVAGARADELHVVRMEPGDVHEDEAAHRLAKLVSGPGVVQH